MRVRILDGGFSTQLQNYVDDTVDGDPLWTAKFLKLQPKKCALVHRDFVMAGADIIITGSYQSSIDGYKRYLGSTKEEALELMKDSVKLAKEGIKMAERETGKQYSHVRVAGSVGPYGAFLHDGSEYTGSYCGQVTEDELITWHRPRVMALLEAGVDFLAIETVPCLKEALALIKLLREFPRASAWISFSVKEESTIPIGTKSRLLKNILQIFTDATLEKLKNMDIDSISSGEDLAECAKVCWRSSRQLIAVGANCFHPSLVTPMFQKVVNLYPEIPIIVYPNNGEIYDGLSKKWLNKEVSVNIEDYVSEWLDIGISIIGGCCRTDSKDISRISYNAQKWEKKQKSSDI